MNSEFVHLFNLYLIYEFLQIKYGDWILYDPELNQKTFILWFLPLLLFLIGGAIIFKSFIIKKN